MKQSRIFDFVPRTGKARPLGLCSAGYGFVDLFCGIGGASQGACEAGLTVLLGIDFCDKLLAIHADNHPEAVHRCGTLPPLAASLLPTRGRWHLHGSPPCTILSQLNKSATEADQNHAKGLVRWFLEVAVASRATSWSMEQVPSKEVVHEVKEAMRLAPGKVDYCVLDCFRLGVPQNRKRLFAGTPLLIRKLRSRRVPSRFVSDVIDEPRGTHTRLEAFQSSSRRRVNGTVVTMAISHTHDDLCRPLNVPCHTVTASNGLRWASPGTKKNSFKMNCDDLKLIQTFPATYKLNCGTTLGRQGIGNAVPPAAMRELLRPITEGRWPRPRRRSVPKAPAARSSTARECSTAA